MNFKACAANLATFSALSLPGLLKPFYMCLDDSGLKDHLSFLFWNYFSVGWQHGKWIIHHVSSTQKIHFFHSGYFRILLRILNCFIILALLFLKSIEHKRTCANAGNKTLPEEQNGKKRDSALWMDPLQGNETEQWKNTLESMSWAYAKLLNCN